MVKNIVISILLENKTCLMLFLVLLIISETGEFQTSFKLKQKPLVLSLGKLSGLAVGHLGQISWLCLQ